jgi:hypothetical protein
MIKLFPARESLVSDILAGEGKNDKLFLQFVSGDNRFENIRSVYGFVCKLKHFKRRLPILGGGERVRI